jgi:hypothetical protein
MLTILELAMTIIKTAARFLLFYGSPADFEFQKCVHTLILVTMFFMICKDAQSDSKLKCEHLRMERIVTLLIMSLRCYILLHISSYVYSKLLHIIKDTKSDGFSQRILTTLSSRSALPSVERDTVCAYCDLTGKHTMLINCLDGTHAGWITPAAVLLMCVLL